MYSFFISLTYSSGSVVLSSIRNRNTSISTFGLSMYSFLSQCVGTSGFVVAISFAPLTDKRDRSIEKKSLGNSVSSSQYAPPSVMPRILFSDFASFAPSRRIFLPNSLPSLVDSEYLKLSSPISSCNSIRQLRFNVCNVFADIR